MSPSPADSGMFSLNLSKTTEPELLISSDGRLSKAAVVTIFSGRWRIDFNAIPSSSCCLTQHCSTERAPHFHSHVREIVPPRKTQPNKPWGVPCCSLGAGTKQVCAVLAQAGPELPGQKVCPGLAALQTPRVWDVTPRGEMETWQHLQPPHCWVPRCATNTCRSGLTHRSCTNTDCWWQISSSALCSISTSSLETTDN